MKYDKEEKNILESLDSEKMKLAKPSKAEIDSIKAAASKTFKKDTINGCPRSGLI